MAANGTTVQDSHRSLVTVSGLLAGFSFTAVMGLLRVANETKTFQVAFIGFLLATFLFLALLFGGWTANEWLSEYEYGQLEQQVFYKATFPLFFGAMFVFTMGVTATAFLYSVLAGVVAIIAALGFMVYIGVATVSFARAESQVKKSQS
jgi:hypothetical protein